MILCLDYLYTSLKVAKDFVAFLEVYMSFSGLSKMR